MKKGAEQKLPEEEAKFVDYIFQGMTISQIAKKLNCSHSTVSYQLTNLYSKYNAKSRYEFVVQVFEKVINNYKLLVNSKSSKVVVLENKMEILKNIMSFLITNQNNPGVFEYWAKEAQKHL